jgi:hypothetical protein
MHGKTDVHKTFVIKPHEKIQIQKFKLKYTTKADLEEQFVRMLTEVDSLRIWSNGRLL